MPRRQRKSHPERLAATARLGILAWRAGGRGVGGGKAVVYSGVAASKTQGHDGAEVLDSEEEGDTAAHPRPCW